MKKKLKYTKGILDISNYEIVLIMSEETISKYSLLILLLVSMFSLDCTCYFRALHKTLLKMWTCMLPALYIFAWKQSLPA